ncbi:protein phyllopod isoform X1 [Drosophila sulfurigaster albostrigata]|uniref:protein phyllopod isoform X1 n=1 Tax=Drosophila sulfurigaster albostrigata TaxID=89887 RepID=UPI002D21DC3A|nr:protein phyllopod isoform X1 [Drosophila sulfurigaster albostrigata]
MSADNQVEPAAAMAASASASAASGGASDYLKRTCLICGCQTNQTINIYEPRSGPNIVQLIQAKFKFQPLNEDKFLCFSCNNWLINWHSLQAVNSNDADSQSRSQSPSHMGNNCSLQQQQQQKAPSMERPRLRPVAQVRPQPKSQPQPQPQRQHQPQPHTQPQPQAQADRQPTTVISYNKRRFGGRSAASTRSMRKMLRYCCVCGGAIVLRLLNTKPTQTLAKLARRSGRSQCRKCREMHKHSVVKVRHLELKKQQDQTLVKAPLAMPQYQRFPAPRVDGKVVAMFRRLGTTLSVEQEDEVEPMPSKRPLRIMSPAKQRPRWTRTLDDDEILLEFDSAISEVLPGTTAPRVTSSARRSLGYQFTKAMQAETEMEAEAEVAEDVVKDNRKRVEKVTHQTHVKLAGLQLPRGLSITLV